MALFKIFHGTAEQFPSDYPLHPGYAYFFDDSGEMLIDTESGRIDVKSAYLVRDGGEEIEVIDVDDVLIAEGEIAENAVLIAGPNKTVKAVAIAQGSLIIGDTTNGASGLAGVGALYASVSGTPTFGTLPINMGGTGATNAAGARTNLDVYSKAETDEQISESTSVAYTTTLAANGWTLNGDMYTQTYSNVNLTCGKAGNVPPLITYTSNLEEYSKIDHADATVGVGITFYIEEQPESDIALIIIDVK